MLRLKLWHDPLNSNANIAVRCPIQGCRYSAYFGCEYARIVKGKVANDVSVSYVNFFVVLTQF